MHAGSELMFLTSLKKSLFRKSHIHTFSYSSHAVRNKPGNGAGLSNSAVKRRETSMQPFLKNKLKRVKCFFLEKRSKKEEGCELMIFF